MCGSIQASGAQLAALRAPDVLGSYLACVKTGTMAAGAAADSPIFTARWTDAGSVCLVHRVLVSISSLGTGFTAGVGTVAAIFARGYTADETAGTAVVLTTNNGKRRTSHRTTAFGVGKMRIASTAAISGGTRTLDANELAARMFPVTTATNFVHLPTTDLLSQSYDGAWPIVLAADEGLIVRATVPATGTWQAQVSIEWAEVAAF